MKIKKRGSLSRLSILYFPKVNGRFQRITKKQTEKEIQKIIEEN